MAITRIASVAGATDSGHATTSSINTTGADFLVLVCSDESASVSAITDSKGNTWNQLTSQVSTVRCTIFWSKPTSVGSGHTFTATATGGYQAIAVAAYSGVAASPFDQQNGAANASASTLATGSITPTQDNELLIAGFAGGNAGTISIDSGFTIRATQAWGAGNNDSVALADLIQTTATAKNPSWSITSGPSYMLVAIASFKAAPTDLPTGRGSDRTEIQRYPKRDPNLFRGDALGLNLPIYFYVPPPPMNQYDWPLPMRKRDPRLWQWGSTTSLSVARDADYNYGLVWVSVNGIARAQGRSGDGMIYAGTLSITDIEGETPSTCTFQARGFTPVVGQEVVITLGSETLQNPKRLFAGNILQVQQVYSGTPSNTSYLVSCIDWTWQLNKRKVSKKYSATTAAAIVADLISTYGTGFTTGNVTLTTAIDAISFTSMDLTACLTQLAKRAGGYWYCDYNKDIHFFASEATTPTALTSDHASLTEFSARRDLSQMITRALSEGGGASLLTDIAAGETILPVETIDWYLPTGGYLALPGMRLTYTGYVAASTGGSLVGPGAAPSASPGAALAIGTGIEAGAHGYAVTFVTGAGESIPGPTRSVTTYTMSAPSAPTVTVIADGTGGYVNAGAHDYVVTFLSSGGGETVASSRTTVTVGSTDRVSLESLPLGDANCVGRRIYRTVANDPGGTLGKVAEISDNVTRSYDDVFTDADLGFAPPVSTTAILQKVNLSGIPIGGASVTSRKVYRTTAGGSTLKLLTTIADNTTTTYADTTADASLGASAPGSDTSGLSQPSGVILAGASTLLVAGTGWAQSGGGWAVIGNGQQVIRYTGISGSSLTGIPATGIGAITAAISYGSTITGAAMLTGIPSSGTGSVTTSVPKGEQANLLMQVDDTAAQAVLAALIGGDGVQEDYQQDGRITATEALARATARIAMQNAVQVSIAYAVRDVETKAGRTISVDLPSPTSVTGDFKIQRVTISGFSASRNLFPTFTVEASSVRFTFEDLLRQITQM